MSGWRIVPHPPTLEMMYAADCCATGGDSALVAGLAAAPEPDWEALAERAQAAYEFGFGKHNSRWIAALKAALGGAK